MNVLLISQCSKNALTETRRILDQFAERRGERTWQTAITMEGLTTLRKLLRKTARKNTAVACHWIRGRDHSELMWIVGNASQFNPEGAVPTNTTRRNVLRRDDENDWHTGGDIKLLAQMAALLHDLGKASVAFQERLRCSLRGQRVGKNLYRHEWVSLRLFQAFVGDDNDAGWLTRLADENINHDSLWTDKKRYRRDDLDVKGADKHPFETLTTQAPLAAAIAWLVVTHHRLPVKPEINRDTGEQQWLGARCTEFRANELPDLLSTVAHDWNEIAQPAEPEKKASYWNISPDIPVVTAAWKKQAARVARNLLALRQKRSDAWLDNPYVMHLSRLCLMLADHHYSSLGLDSNDRPVATRQSVQSDNSLAANTTRNRHGKTVLNQSLLEHLLGVAQGAASIAHALPGFERYLPRLANHRGLRKRSGNPRFAWQDKAFDAAMSVREAAREQGAFIINMASTGCGKTLANARMLYALSDPQQGMRATYALGLRTLTLQTGRSYRHDLHLDEDELAILVGGSASRELFEYYEEKAEHTGSASIQELIEEDSHVLYEGQHADHPLLARALANADIRKLLSAPLLVCTVDHLVPATESQRAGRQIAPMLRLMSSDLILDELDDYDLNDLPALTRLVHWAGLLGSRIILSSATLPPALVEGMFLSYHAGRQHYLKNRGIHGGQPEQAPEIPCLWVDEFSVHVATCAGAGELSQQHQQFVDKRSRKLVQQNPLRRADILPVEVKERQPEQIHQAFAEVIRDGCLRLHHAHNETDPVGGKQVSFGIVRMANIEPLIGVAKALQSLGMPDDTHLHLCVYHSRFPLVQRSAIEHLLDTSFNRRADGGMAVYHQPAIRQALDINPAQHHLFAVLASPVCEVGRDWDADWAIAEPSSMRSLIQLAGRVQRHRRKVPKEPNMLLLNAPFKHFEKTDALVYQKPGFEKAGFNGRFTLASHHLSELLLPEEYQVLSAIPRIAPRPALQRNPQQNLVDLEQARMEASMLPVATPVASGRRRVVVAGLEQDQAAPAWQSPQAMLSAVLPQQQPFRDSAGQRTVMLVLRPDEDEENLLLYRMENNPSARREKLYVQVEDSLRHEVRLPVVQGISAWGKFDLLTLLQEQADSLGISLESCANKMAVVEVLDSAQGWFWHPWLGFWKKQ